jgi:hypothetical protein
MARKVGIWALGLVAASLVCFSAGRAAAQNVIISTPVVSYYSPPPVVSYYSPPVVYTPAPTVSYYSGPVVPAATTYVVPTVTTYTPTVTYYAAPTVVTTTRYGLFGRPRVSTTYYAPVYVR